MAPVVIDLTTSPEPDDFLDTAAKSALRPFQPRKQRPASEASNNDDAGSSEADAWNALSTFQPRKQKEHPKGHWKTPGAGPGATAHASTNGGRPEENSNEVQHGLKKLPHYTPVRLNEASHTYEGNGGSQKLLHTHSERARQSLIQQHVSVPPMRNASVALSKTDDQQPAEMRNQNQTQVRSVIPSSKPRSSSDERAAAAIELPLIAFAGRGLPLSKDVHLAKRGASAGASEDAEDMDGSNRLTLLNESFESNGVLLRPFKRRRVDQPKERSSGSIGKVAIAQPFFQKAKGAYSSASRPAPLIHIRSASPPNKAPSNSSEGWSGNQSRLLVATTDSSRERTEVLSGMGASSPYRSSARSSALVSPRGRHPLAEAVRVRETRDSDSVGGGDAWKGIHNVNESSRELCNPAQMRPSQKYSSLQRKDSQTSSNGVTSPTPPSDGAPGRFGAEYTAADDQLLIKLKEIDQLSWKDIFPYFPSRSSGSLQVRYSTKLRHRNSRLENARKLKQKHEPTGAQAESVKSLVPSRGITPPPARPQRRKRNNEPSAVSGFISWAEVKQRRLDKDADAESTVKESTVKEPSTKAVRYVPQFSGERSHPKSLHRLLRQRELGSDHARTSTAPRRSVRDEIKEHVFENIGPVQYFKGTSGDVTCLAWSPNGSKYAAGSIAISDERSMQYNRPCNLVIGDRERGFLQELAEHHVPRPKIDSNTENVNSLHSMRETQDPRLFMTVASVQFSPDGETLYSAGSDRKVRAYSTANNRISCKYELDHTAPLDLLSVSNTDLLATACHQAQDNSIGVYRGKERLLSLSPSRVDQETERPIYPSALRWGTAWHHSNLLLAGFSIDSTDEERNIAGETCLWDVVAQAPIKINGVTRNVFDVTWNPLASFSSTSFAVASVPGSERGSKDTRSIVQCFAPGQNKAVRVIEWQCPAFDINDVLFCQHDDNLIAAGGTDGKVYVWDQRFANRSHAPLHVLEHGDTLNVLDHDREREIADTGVRFISWGATSSRFYTGSSDGVVKVWNPYMSSENAHIKDLATFTSAVMSGAFSPDYRDLVIGEDQGRINLLSVGNESKAVRAMRRLILQSAPAPSNKENPLLAARELLDSHQIVLRPMGDLPIRQAVQGPKYAGPYLAPSANDVLQAGDRYELAMNQQQVARAIAKMDPLDDSEGESEQALRKANLRARDAKDKVRSLRQKAEDAAILEPQARANQEALRLREKVPSYLKRGDDSCKLDCNYLPPSFDDEEVPDSQRSQARIPGHLFSIPIVNSANMTTEDVAESEFTHYCISCLVPARKPGRGKQALCEQCFCTRSGLTASCAKCSAPIRPAATGSSSELCETCNFSCFRCGRRCGVVRYGLRVKCYHCRVTWEAGVLGYEVQAASRASTEVARSGSHRDESDESYENDDDELGNMEYYASLWQ